MLRCAYGQSSKLLAQDALEDVLMQCASFTRMEKPQAGMVFLSNHDWNGSSILQGFAQSYPGTDFIGCVTQGEVTSKFGFTEESLSVLLLDADEIRIAAGLGRECSQDRDGSARQAVSLAQSKLPGACETALAITIFDGLTAGGGESINALRDIQGDGIPIFGLASGTLSTTRQSQQFFGTEILEDSLSLLLFQGPLQYAFGQANGWEPLGHKGVVTRAIGNRVYSIDGKPAREFYRRYLGTEFRLEAQVRVCFPLAVFPDNDSDFFLRKPIFFHDDGSISLMGNIPEHAAVSISDAGRQQLAHAAQQALGHTATMFGNDEPEIMFMFSGVSRRHILGSRVNDEYLAIPRRYPHLPCFFGCYGFGEIAPAAGNTASVLHNDSVVYLGLRESQNLWIQSSTGQRDVSNPDVVIMGHAQ